MQNNLLDILNSIGLESELQEEFKNASLKKIFVDKSTKTYRIIIETEKEIDDKITNKIIELFKSKFKTIKDTKIEYYIKNKIQLNQEDKLKQSNNNINFEKNGSRS